jgi:hypothetical protein
MAIFNPEGPKLKFIVRQTTGVVKGSFSVYVYNGANEVIETPIPSKDLNKPMINRKTIETQPSDLAGARIELNSTFHFVDAMVKKCSIELEIFQDEQTIHLREKTREFESLEKMEHIVIQYRPGGTD